ncbi:MAG: cation diffusion facilitator family transporter [Candidatus Marinimicrobia bacterium]|nr:cation diffusion facilitator family transporter [Candidatus Neomarinimicrobiota bacterium]
MKSNDVRAAKANKVTWIGFFTNLLLTAFKMVAGIVGQSGAMIADAVHSLSDFITDIVVLVSFQVIRKPIDREHDYGHGKFETLATAFIGLALLVVGVGIFWQGGKKIILNLSGSPLEKPGNIALIAAIISVILKELLYRYTVKIGDEISSQAVVANAWHHRSDAFSSIGTTIGIGGAILLGDNWRILDPIAAVIVSFFIIKVAYSITVVSIRELSEGSLDDSIESEIIEVVSNCPGIIKPHNLRTRKIGYNIAIDIHVRVDPNLSICEAHDIATNVEKQIRNKYGADTFISVHTEPNLLIE